MRQGSPRIKHQHVAQKAAGVPANCPGIVSPCNLVLEHLQKSHSTVEIKSTTEIARLELSQQRGTIRVIFLPAIAPCRPSPAIRPPDEVRFRHLSRHRKTKAGYTANTRTIPVVAQGVVHKPKEKWTNDDVVLQHDDRFPKAQNFRDAFGNIARQAKIRITGNDVSGRKSEIPLNQLSNRIDVSGRRHIPGAIAEDKQFGLRRFGIGPKRLQRLLEMDGPAIGEQRYRRKGRGFGCHEGCRSDVVRRNSRPISTARSGAFGTFGSSATRNCRSRRNPRAVTKSTIRRRLMNQPGYSVI